MLFWDEGLNYQTERKHVIIHELLHFRHRNNVKLFEQVLKAYMDSGNKERMSRRFSAKFEMIEEDTTRFYEENGNIFLKRLY